MGSLVTERRKGKERKEKRRGEKEGREGGRKGPKSTSKDVNIINREKNIKAIMRSCYIVTGMVSTKRLTIPSVDKDVTQQELLTLCC